MPNESSTPTHDNPDVHEGQTIRKCIDEDTPDRSTNPKVDEDPGLLPLSEDPRERRLKRNTM